MAKTFNVRMPDGTVIKNVPEDATKEEIQAAYEKFKTESSKHIGQKVLDKVMGTLEKNIQDYAPDIPLVPFGRPQLEATVGAGEVMAGDIGEYTSMAMGGVAGLGAGIVESIRQGSIDKGMEAFQDVSEGVRERLNPFTYEPRTSIGKRGAQTFQEGYEASREGIGKGAEVVSKAYRESLLERRYRDILGEQRGDEDEKEREEIQNKIDAGGAGIRTAGEFLFDAAVNLLPAKWGLDMARRRRLSYEQEKLDRELFEEKVKKLAEEKRVSAEYEKGLIDLDNTMIQYPDRLLAPQLGMGAARRKPVVPEDGSRANKERPDGEGSRYTQDSLDADLEALRTDPNAPLDFTPPISEMPGGLEITQRGGPPIVWERPPVRIADVPLESMLVQDHQPVRGPESMRGGSPNIPTRPVIPDPLSLDIDPVTRITAIEHLSNPAMRKAVSDLDAIERAIEILKRQYNDPVLQRGVDMNEALGLNKAKRLNDEIFRLEKKRWEAIARIEQGMRDALEAAKRNPPKIERTFDGRRMVTLPGKLGKQAGRIDEDLLTLGVSALIRKFGETHAYRKFEGIFRKDSLETLAYYTNTPSSPWKASWISPELFHKLAYKRIGEDAEAFAEETRKPLRPIVKSPASEGLTSMPILKLEMLRIRPKDGALLLKVVGHNGRHRMDIMKELNLEQVPVGLHLPTNVRKALEEAQRTGQKVMLESEDGIYEVPFPGIAKIENYGSPKPTTIPTSQLGSANTKLLADIATLGVASLVRKGLERKAKTPKAKPATATNAKQKDANAVLEAASGETRTLDEFKQTLKPEQLNEDIPDSLVNGGAANLSNASFLNHYSNHPLVKYTLERVRNIVMTNNLMGSMVKEGFLFGIKGLVSRTVDPNSPKGLWHSLSRKEQEQLVSIANEYGGRYELSRQELKTLGVSNRVADTYKAFVDAYSQALDDVNSVRKPEEQINKLPGYFTKYRNGDFKISVIDKRTGDTVYSDLFWTKFGAKSMVKELKARFKDGDYEIKGVEEIDRGSRGNPYNVSTVPFEEIMQGIGRNDPRYRAIESAVREIRGKRGFGRHAIHRRNISGGDLTPENFYKAFENYIDSAYRYKSNMEMRKMSQEFQFDTEIQAPKLKRWVNDYVELASGNFKPGWLVDAIYSLAVGVTKLVTLGQTGKSMPTRILRSLNNYFMWKALFSYRPAFLIAQIAQPFAFSPQWIAHYQAKGFNGPSVAKTSYLALKYQVDAVAGKPDPDYKKFISEYLVPRGGIDPTMIHEMDLFWDKGGTDAKRWITGHAPAQKIESFGRFEAATAGYAFFREAGLKGKELYTQAERFMNDVMVDYNKQEQPSWVGRTGIIGQAAGPLSTFFTNFASTTVLFMKDILDNPGKAASYKPMAIHIAQTMFWAGLSGTLGAKIIDGLIWIFKHLKALPEDFPSFTEWVLTEKKIPDWAAFGAVSGMTGMNFGASMAAPDIHAPSANTFPGVKLLVDLVTDLWPVVNPFGPGSTQAQRQQAFKTILPNYLASLMDVYEIELLKDPREGFLGAKIRRRQPGEIVPNTRKRGFGNVAPSEKDQQARMLGTRSLAETRELEGVYRSQENQDLKNKSKTQLIDLAVDALTYSEGYDFADLMQQAIDLGMTPDQFKNAIKSTIQNRQLEAEARATGKKGPRSPSALQKYEKIESYKRPEGVSTNYSEPESVSASNIDDGASAARALKDQIWKRRHRQIQFTELRDLIALAKRVYPNDERKQKEFIKEILESREASKEEKNDHLRRGQKTRSRWEYWM